MNIKTKEFKEACTVILTATQGSQAAVTTNELELRTEGRTLLLNVASPEYNVKVRFPIDHEEAFHVTVNADLFLKLVAQITTEELDMSVKDSALHISANGKYKLPAIFNADKMLEVNKIEIMNTTVQMNIDSDILHSIYTYNSKELQKGTVRYAIQRYYYVDEQGCITFTSGACINSFQLDKPVKLLLTNKIVKLFKLFKEGDVQFTLGHDPISDTIIQTKVKFETPSVVICAILSCDDAPINSVPVKALRGRAEAIYPFTVNLNRNALLQAINRLLLFSPANAEMLLNRDTGVFTFGPESLTVWDFEKSNTEYIPYSYNNMDGRSYEAMLNLEDLKTTLETMSEANITLSFGDHVAFIAKRNNITIEIPECKLSQRSYSD